MAKKSISFMLYSCLVMLLLSASPVKAQRLLYPSHFDLSEVTLLDSPFKKAQERNCQALLDYDVDRLLTPYIRQAGLSKDPSSPYNGWESKHPSFQNWSWPPELAMDGHVTGHYLSALSMSYASSRDNGVKEKLLERINHIVDVLCDCQAVFDNDKKGLKGFIGGIPDNEVWSALYSGDYRIYNQRGNWAPIYCEHKVMAGLRDAYVHAGNQKALEAFRKMCDWIIDVVHNFKDQDMEMQILQWEPGGINEVLADAYKLFDDSKYLKGANKFSHQIMVENIIRDEAHKFLDLKNVNEATAKFVGYARISELKNDDKYNRATLTFWNDAARRMTAISGTGINSNFQPVNKSTRFISEADGPDACSTYNMLKLAERLFDRGRNARYSDYYESAMLNHILGNQDPETGGYVYHTSLRPDSYRIYSRPNQAMWCCVGTGMESQSKYGDFIYTFSEDTLFVNLFIASDLNSSKIALTQETDFPYGQSSKITVQKNGNYVIAVRRPSWTNENYSVTVNGKAPKGFKSTQKDADCFYVSCGKSWKAGDVIEVSYPMSLSFEECPRVPTYIALKYGPTILAGVTERSTQQHPFENEYAGIGRRDHSNSVRQPEHSLASAPMLITDRSRVPARITPKDPDKLIFSVDASAPASQWKDVDLIPFFETHHCKYTVYWNQQTETAWLRNPLYQREKAANAIAMYTFDSIKIGNDEDEKAHNMKISAMGSCGSLNGLPFRDCQAGEWFQYDLVLAEKVQFTNQDSIQVVLRLSLIDRGRKGAIYVNGEKVQDIVVPAKVSNATKDRFFEWPITISAQKVSGSKFVNIRLAAGETSFPRLYGLRITKKE